MRQIGYLVFAAFLISLPFALTGNRQLIVPVVADVLNVRSAPSMKSAVVDRVEIGKLVKILAKKSKPEYVDGKWGKWVFIDTCRRRAGFDDNPKGWIFDYYLGYPERFRRVPHPISGKVKVIGGDLLYDIRIDQNGHYRLLRLYMSGSKEHRSESSGYLEYFRNLYRVRGVAEKKEVFFLYLKIDKMGKYQFIW